MPSRLSDSIHSDIALWAMRDIVSFLMEHNPPELMSEADLIKLRSAFGAMNAAYGTEKIWGLLAHECDARGIEVDWYARQRIRRAEAEQEQS